MVADALSCCEPTEGAVSALSGPTFQFYDDLRAQNTQDHEWQRRRDQIADGTLGQPWSIIDDLIRHSHRVFVPASSTLLPVVLNLAHAAGHGGIQKTLQLLHTDFFVSKDQACYG
ncbi:hypothetical protein U9M48_039670 [Paspalum notatum var. saurae]|uniref:Uncharacterized protein n=1 Tax=Paspalum notatum var. saurae TaxID=547442 RepID=A0AAQ3UNZ1_PASNO